MSESIVYCVDSSALIDLRMYYRRKTFVTLWQKLGNLVRSKRLIAPREVWKEVKRDDEIPAWIRSNAGLRRMFVPLKVGAIRIAADIVAHFPALVDPDKETPDADPFLVALAVYQNGEQQDLFAPRRHIVLTSEKPSRGGRPKIPDVCQQYEVECLSGSTALAQFFEREGWKF
jgi:hypothetical protein